MQQKEAANHTRFARSADLIFVFQIFSTGFFVFVFFFKKIVCSTVSVHQFAFQFRSNQLNLSYHITLNERHAWTVCEYKLSAIFLPNCDSMLCGISHNIECVLIQTAWKNLNYFATFFLQFQIGTVAGNLLSGLLLTQYSWPSVFYVFGGAAIVWFIVFVSKTDWITNQLHSKHFE